jgi:gluconolactonase
MVDTGVPNGIKCDMAGNVYAACGDGLNVWNSAGTLIGKALIPGGISNFCFARNGELFLLNETRFWIMTVANNVVGAVLERMRERVGGARAVPTNGNRDRDSDADSMASLFA